MVYARQLGIKEVGPVAVADESATAGELLVVARDLGVTGVNTKTRKAVLVSKINDAFLAMSASVDVSKLTARQRRRLAKKGER